MVYVRVVSGEQERKRCIRAIGRYLGGFVRANVKPDDLLPTDAVFSAARTLVEEVEREPGYELNVCVIGVVKGTDTEDNRRKITAALPFGDPPPYYEWEVMVQEPCVDISSDEE